MSATELLDAKGLNCPLPILHARKKLNAMSTGFELKLTEYVFTNDLEYDFIETANGLQILTAAHVVSDYTFLQVQRGATQNPNK